MNPEQQDVLQGAWAGLREGDLPRAWRLCQTLVKQFPDDAAGLDVASRVALAMGQRRLAEQLAERAVSLAPQEFAYLAQRAFSLLALKKTGEAIDCIDLLAATPTEHPVDLDTLGNLFSLLGDQARALEYFQRAVSSDPDSAHFWLNLALSLQATGDLEQAETAFDRCIALDPGEGEAWLHRSRLRSQSAERNHVEALQAVLAGDARDWRREMTLRYALAKELEDLCQYSESFEQLRRGSGLRRSHMNHDPSADLQAMKTVKQVFTGNYLDQGASGHDSPEPIFIVGLPRTGTTLVERILGSHNEVFAAGELNNFAESLAGLVAPGKPADRMEFIRLSAGVDSELLGRKYIESTRPLTGSTPRFVDKLPLNFLYCGLIHRALPRAKIIHLQRNPMDACFAIYKTLFKQAYPFSYDLQELGQYFLAYRELMAHWHCIMPGVILDLEYESLVAEPEAQTRRLLDFCELPFEDACLQFHRSSAPSMTASLAQVRQPVYTSSIGKWRHYEEELTPLRTALQAGLPEIQAN